MIYNIIRRSVQRNNYQQFLLPAQKTTDTAINVRYESTKLNQNPAGEENKQDKSSKSRSFLGFVVLNAIGGSVYLYYYPEARRKIQQQIEENVPISKKVFEKFGTFYEAIKAKQQRLHIQQIEVQNSPGTVTPVSQILPTKEENKKLTEQDLSASLKQANIHIKNLKQQLHEYQNQEKQKIAEAVEEQRKMDEKLAKLHLDIELARIKDSSEDVGVKFGDERNLLEATEAQLKKAEQAHAEHLENVIRTQKQIHDIESAQLVEEAIAKERNKYLHQIQSALEKLKGIEQALNSRTAQDLENRRSKIFWTVCQKLLQSLQENPDGQFATKLFEIAFIRDLTEYDDFVQSICNCFPEQATKEGIPTEDGLRKRFGRVYKLARRTAQIGENGGGLLEYFFSWLQSLFVFHLPTAYSAEDKLNLDKYDPYDVLNRIKYFVAEGDFANAVRLAQLLRGEPRQIFFTWITDAQLHLEARYLTELLLSHAQVSTIRTTY